MNSRSQVTEVAPVTDLDALENQDDFIRRHIGPDAVEIASMLETLGEDSLEAVIRAAVPASILLGRELDMPGAMHEHAALAKLAALVADDSGGRSFAGLGYFDTWTPGVILRNVLENPGWYTAYTPYQPEISQGRLECLLNFQQMVMDLTAMPIANASLLDEATAAAEGMTLAKRVSKNKTSNTFFVDRRCYPQTIDVIRTRAPGFGIKVVVDDLCRLDQHDVFGALFQYPDGEGRVDDLSGYIAALHEKQAIAVVAADLLSLVLLKPPGEMGADVVVGNTQRFGVPMAYGGPHAAYFATRDDYKRSVPGRMIGVSIDSRGAPALRMALQTREQHIRREKANSNICTAQALLANVAVLYAMYHGPGGLAVIAQRVHRLTALLARALQTQGVQVCESRFFDTLTLSFTAGQVAEIAARARVAGIHLGLHNIARSLVSISLDECTTREDLAKLLAVLLGDDSKVPDLKALEKDIDQHIPPALVRQSEFLTHPVFNDYRSETEMLRYLKKLENRDLSLTHSMIPLGSCTMKLNASAEMAPISWPQFSRVHPFVPVAAVPGYQQMITGLGDMLAEILGFDGVSMQPNSGAQGEYAGLLAISRYHESRGDTRRDVCLIPSSAHGTNPASAQMVGLKVVIVACDANGNIDIDDLRAKAEANSASLAALMLTYPSTHGVFEEQVKQVCRVVHDHGGQVYMDGANLNAMVGIARPGDIGADVSHVNLHKTFCIPHGGGGPGMGPIGVKAHLVPFLPGHCLAGPAGRRECAAVSAAPWGSAGILPISWMYITMMGGDGLKRATQVAILSANYLARKLAPHYPVLYTGKNGMVAHECIIDLRPIKQASGIDNEDVAKRLMDFGFHAPTMSFPVAGTLMIEPTESESKAELDRFIEAMILIRAEIAAVEAGEVSAEDSVLRRAPHTLADISASDWDRPYTREQAAFPAAWLKHAKYWPAVNRVDNVYGDRHLVCSCPPIEAYQ